MKNRYVKSASPRVLLGMTRPFFSIIYSGLLTSAISILLGGLSIVMTLQLSLFFMLLTGSLNSYNNIVDMNVDSITKPSRPFPQGLIERTQATRFSLTLYVLTLATLVVLSLGHPVVFPILACDVVLSYVFSAKPIRLKRFPIVKGSVLVAHSLIFPLLAVTIIRNWPTIQELITLIPLFIMGIATHSLQDYEDIEGDKAIGDVTLPIFFGPKSSTLMISLLYLAALAVALRIPHPMWIYTVVLLVLQPIFTLFLLKSERIGPMLFRINALLSLATVIALLIR